MYESKRGKRRLKKGIEYDYESAFDKDYEQLDEYFRKNIFRLKKCIYTLKEIRAGEQLEVEIYPEFAKRSDIPDGWRLKKDNSRAQKKLNDKNARKNAERIINANFNDMDIWATLTYAPGEEPEDMTEALKNMQRYIRRVNYQRKKKGLPNAKYIYITEHSPQQKIRWHHHLVISGDTGLDIVESVWKKGRRNHVRRIKKDEYGLAGMAIYITKEKHRGKHERRWNASLNLKKPDIRKMRNKKPRESQGAYRPIERYVSDFKRYGNAAVENQMKQWYSDYYYTESQIRYNDFNGMFYIRARMRRRNEKDRRRQTDIDNYWSSAGNICPALSSSFCTGLRMRE